MHFPLSSHASKNIVSSFLISVEVYKNTARKHKLLIRLTEYFKPQELVKISVPILLLALY